MITKEEATRGFRQFIGAPGEGRFEFGIYQNEAAGLVVGLSFLKISGRLQPCFDRAFDGWYEMPTFKTVIQKVGLVDAGTITPLIFRNMLLELGFTDITKEKQE